MPDAPKDADDTATAKDGGGLGRFTLKALAVIVVGVLVLGFLLLRTAAGHRVILEWGLDRARGAVAGDIEVGDIRSANLFRGARLMDVRLLTPEGDTLAAVDSLQMSYSVGAILDGRLGVSNVRVWGGRIDYTQASADSASSLDRWIGGLEADTTVGGDPSAEAPSAGDGGGGFGGFTLDRVELVDVAFRMRVPTEIEPGGVVRVDSTGTNRLELDVGISQALVPSVRIGGSGEATEVEVARATARVDILREPLFIERLAADVRIEGGVVDVDLRDLLMAEARADGTVRVSLDPAADSIVDVGLELSNLDTRELQWISEGLPALTGSTRLEGRIRQDRNEWTLEGAEFLWDGADVRGGGTVVLGTGTMRLQGVDVQTSGLPVESLRPWLPPDMELGGRLGGRLAASGALSRLEVDGEVTWTTPLGEPIALRGVGAVTGLDGGSSIGFDGFNAVLGPFEWSALRRSAGIAVPIDGPGSVRAELFGSLGTGLRISGEARHLGGTVTDTPSRVLIDGIVRQREGVFGLDLSADLSPLALDIFRAPADSAAGPRAASSDLPLAGTVSGSVRLTGDMEDLRVSADLQDGVGQVSFDVDLSPRDPTSNWAVTGTADGLSGEILSMLGENTSITGDFSASGGGSTMADVDALVSARFSASRISSVPVDSLVVDARIAAGRLELDSLHGRLGGFSVDAAGELALTDSVRSGTIDATFSTESLLGLRSTFLGDSILARPADGLERRALEAEGIDPDTLPAPEEVEWDGAVEGSATLTGWIESFELDGAAVARDVRIGPHRVDSVALTARGVRLPGADAEVTVDASADSLLVFDRSFTAARMEGTLRRESGEFVLDLARGSTEEYVAEGAYELDGALRRVRLESLAARFDEDTYELQRPTSVAWGDAALVVDDLEIRRVGPDPVVIRADGRLPDSGAIEFELSVEGMDLERLTQVMQRPDIDLAGRVDFTATLGGTAAEPEGVAILEADSLRWRELEVASLNGRIDYADRMADLELLADRGGDVILDVRGEIPVDLALVPGTERFPDREMFVEIVADDLPARATVAPLDDLENVEGLVSGRFEIAGTLDEPRTSGSLSFEDGAWTVGSLGVRHTDVSGTAQLGEDNVLDVSVTGRAGGTVDVEGTITLEPLTDPTFDLAFTFDEFLGVDRRDMVGTFSGEARLTETYRSPDVTGTLVVDEGTIWLDEFVRSAQVVDLTNTRLSGLLGQESGNRLLEIEGNPFMNGLRAAIDLTIDADTWIRGQDIEVEMVGDITMVYDRRARDLALVGELTARRGQYTTVGRTFQVQDGTIGFYGEPGVNPALDITATTRVRRREFGDLTVTANVVGTLMEPRVELSTDEEALSESDIYSYLLTGQPSSGITSSFAGSSNQAFGTVAGSVLSGVTGTIFSRLGALAAQQTDVIDYLSITGGSDVAGTGAGGSALSSTRVEVGRYFAGGDIFGAVVFRAADLGTQPVGGARLEWQSSDQFHVEAFFEDRFLRVASAGLAGLGAGSSYIFGFALVREWGY